MNQFFNTIARLNRKVINSPLELKNNHYEINFADFEQKITEENVKLFILCSPHNPGGRVWTKSELEKISCICLKHNVPVISDEIHSDIVFSKNVHTIYASLSEEALNNSIICTAPSKTFNLAGRRHNVWHRRKKFPADKSCHSKKNSGRSFKKNMPRTVIQSLILEGTARGIKKVFLAN